MTDKTYFSVGMKAVIRRNDGRVLILRRADRGGQRGDESWDVPGGRIIFGMGLDDNLKREVKEETGLELLKIGEVLNVSTFLHGSDPFNQIVRLYVLAEVDQYEEIVLSEEHLEYRWIKTEEIDEINTYSESLKMAIKCLDKITERKDNIIIPGILANG